MSAIPLYNDANRRVGATTHLEYSRRNSISDKGRLGEEGPYKDGEFVMYSSGTDSGSERVGSPRKAPMPQNVLPATSKAAPLSSRRTSDDSRTNMHVEKDMDLRSDSVRDRGTEKEKGHESTADGWERDGKGWVPKDQEGVRGKAISNISSSSSSRRDSHGQGKSEKGKITSKGNDEVRCVLVCVA